MRKTHQISEIREGIKITKVYEFGDSVQIGNVKGIVIKRVKKRKYLYYFIVMEDTGLHANDCRCLPFLLLLLINLHALLV